MVNGSPDTDFKTIADFRKNKGKAIRAVCREFIVLCRQLNLFADAIVAIDGSKFKPVNNHSRNFTRAKMKRRMEQVEKSLDRYFKQLDSADREEPNTAKVKTENIKEKISALKQRMNALKEIDVQMQETRDKQISLADPDARSMTSGRSRLFKMRYEKHWNGIRS